MEALLLAGVCMSWAWWLRARILDRRDRLGMERGWGAMTEYEARTTRPLKGYHLAEDRGAVIPGGALVTVTEHGGVLTATAYRPDGPYGINLDPNNPQIKPVTKAGKS